MSAPLLRWSGRREVERLMRSPLGAIAELPWLDAVGIFALRRWFFPLSRLWAAAATAEGQVTRFLEGAGIAGRNPAVALAASVALSRHGAAYRRLAAATTSWDAAFFGDAAMDEATLAAREAERLAAAFRHLATRAAFYPLWALADAPPVRWEIASREALAEVHGAWRERPDLAYAAPAPPAVAVSPAYRVPAGTRRWLRFASPSSRMGDDAFARVTEPPDAPGAPDAPCVIVANGLCVEVDYLEGGLEVAATLAGMGLRVVELVTPWHGRRAPAGWYGGEPFFGRAPLGALDLFVAEVAEIAALVGWARARYATPVGVAGFSLGALAAQLVASHCGAWPAAMRPDAVFLAAHSGRLENVTFAGRLTVELGLGDALARAGWHLDALLEWRALLNPADRAALDPTRIVSVVGLSDRITPAADGVALCARWGVPEANRFVSNQCHFSKPVHLFRHRAPLERLHALLADAPTYADSN